MPKHGDPPVCAMPECYPNCRGGTSSTAQCTMASIPEAASSSKRIDLPFVPGAKASHFTSGVTGAPAVK